MAIIEGFVKAENYIQTEQGKKLLSRWTSSDSVDVDGTTLTSTLSSMDDDIDAKIPSSEKGVAGGVATLDATTGVIPVGQLPKVALDTLVKVADDTARFALTTESVQNGDTVYVIDTELMYLVIDDTKLNSEDGYQGYSATTTWSTIEERPSNIINYSKNYGTITIPDPIVTIPVNSYQQMPDANGGFVD